MGEVCNWARYFAAGAELGEEGRGREPEDSWKVSSGLATVRRFKPQYLCKLQPRDPGVSELPALRLDHNPSKITSSWQALCTSSFQESQPLSQYLKGL